MFKFVVLCAFVGFAVALGPRAGAYRQPAQRAYNVAPAPRAVHHHSSGPSDDVHAEATSLHNDVRADGFDYGYETTNHIHAVAKGDEHGNQQGSFDWISPEGEAVQLSYVADENGYQPSSAWLPTPPPIPDYILRSLEYIRTHPPKEEVYRNNYHH